MRFFQASYGKPDNINWKLFNLSPGIPQEMCDFFEKVGTRNAPQNLNPQDMRDEAGNPLLLREICSQADILVAAVGKAGFVTADMVKEGAVVIDVGMNRNAEGKLCGDVDFEAVEKKAGYITPVPGGVGPMTITGLMRNTIDATRRQHGPK